MPGDILKGFTFSGTSPNNAVTAPNLNNLVDQSTILTGFYTNKSEKTAPVAADMSLIYDSVSGTFKKVSVQNLVPAFATRTGANGLVIGTTNSNTRISVTASEVLMSTTSGTPYHVSSFSTSILPFSGTGANALDTGAMAATTWYYIWIIGTGSLSAGLLSLSATSPTLPATYTYKCLVGAIRTPTAGSVLVQTLQYGNSVIVDLGSDATDTTSTLQVPQIASASFSAHQINATANTLTAVDLSRCVPPNITARVQGLIGFSTGTTAITYALSPALDAGHLMTGTGANIVVPNYGLSIHQVSEGSSHYFGFNGCSSFNISMSSTASTIYAACDNTVSRHTMRITGYLLDL